MKTKFINFLLGFVSCLILCLLISKMAITSDAAPGYTVAQFSYPVVLNGSKVAVDAVSINDKTYLPVRQIGDLTGTSVQWNDAKKQIEIKHKANPNPFIKSNLKIQFNNKDVSGVDLYQNGSNFYMNVKQLEKLLKNVNFGWETRVDKNNYFGISQGSALIIFEEKGFTYLSWPYAERYPSSVPYSTEVHSGSFNILDGKGNVVAGCPTNGTWDSVELDWFVKNVLPKLPKIIKANEDYLKSHPVKK